MASAARDPGKPAEGDCLPPDTTASIEHPCYSAAELSPTVVLRVSVEQTAAQHHILALPEHRCTIEHFGNAGALETIELVGVGVVGSAREQAALVLLALTVAGVGVLSPFRFNRGAYAYRG